MKRTILILVLCIYSFTVVEDSTYAQSATTQVTKEVAETVLLKKAVKKGAQKFARKKLGNKIAEQAALRIARDKVTRCMEREGVQTFKALNKKVVHKKLKASMLKSARIRSGRIAAKSYLKNSYKRSLQLKSRGFLTYRNRGFVGRPSAVRASVHKNNQFISCYKYDRIMRNPIKSKKMEFGYKKDAEKLRNNMCVAMGKDAKFVSTSVDNRAHHLVGGGAASTPARKKLEKYGIDINDARNGIFLPNNEKSMIKGPTHTGKHTDKYFEAVNKEFKGCKSKEDCLDALDVVKEKIYNGEIPLYVIPGYNL